MTYRAGCADQRDTSAVVRTGRGDAPLSFWLCGQQRVDFRACRCTQASSEMCAFQRGGGIGKARRRGDRLALADRERKSAVKHVACGKRVDRVHTAERGLGAP